MGKAPQKASPPNATPTQQRSPSNGVIFMQMCILSRGAIVGNAGDCAVIGHWSLFLG
ncbi:hypothetical protein [Anabaena sp. CCY 0017]|uniref:hypothetical protein n=1 Tax=Anabaena sp. CCY 0017 TaxID=3103866 RepID=UPI0039C6DBE2